MTNSSTHFKAAALVRFRHVQAIVNTFFIQSIYVRTRCGVPCGLPAKIVRQISFTPFISPANIINNISMIYPHIFPSTILHCYDTCRCTRSIRCVLKSIYSTIHPSLGEREREIESENLGKLHYYDKAQYTRQCKLRVCYNL